MTVADMHARMRAGETFLGLGVRLARSTEVAQVAKACGFDWLFIDMEHCSLDPDMAAQMAMAAEGAGLLSLVRVPGHEPTIASRILDNGAGGIVVPHVDSPEEIRPIIERCKFAPVGRRSMGGALPQLGYGSLPAEEHMRATNANTMIVAMIESPKAVENAAAIAAMDGVDMLLVGSNDLAMEMGIPGDLGNPRMEEAYRRVIGAAQKAGKLAGLGGIYTAPLLERYLPLGFRLVLAGSDMSFVLAGGRERVALARGIAGG
ncbi:HpcH/HpaI aldolase family protein [Marinimicrococcus flavescens]|uniref:Aldolase/citrate lyase family protein n=1 Tax=Marinimicrococcus flavescens TaxID=3031815 RepID=A0AAP4D6L7_9PROT|nr:aldolase/citrate lyase family protein [Marinimicrococcus flavescens]